MPTRTSYAGSIVAADLITAANNNKLPGGLVAYVFGTGTATYTGGGASTAIDVSLAGDLGLELHYAPVNATRSLLIMASVAVRPDVLSVPDIVAIRLEKDGNEIDASSEDFQNTHTHAIKLSTVDIAPTATSHTYRLFFHIYAPSVTDYAVGGSATGMQIFDMGPSF